jgi:hypothetical protein
VNGARGVIINVTGGPDLSLMEVSDASTIVQEAADEDANIIFGAVVDPALTGKVKITVIATGFGPIEGIRGGASHATTPVDLTQYGEGARLRADSAAAAAAGAGERLTLRRPGNGRRALVDMPLPVAAGGGAGAQGFPRGDANSANPAADEDMNSTFDVPAFLRRQEG